MPIPNQKQVCRFCRLEFVPSRTNKLYCRPDCYQGDLRQRYARLNEHRTWPVPSATVGAIHELVVATDLLKRGHHVFRAMSPACPCDLVVLENGSLLRVEVTTGFLSSKGTVHHPLKPRARYDILAVVSGGTIRYTPDLPLLSPKKSRERHDSEQAQPGQVGDGA